MPTAIVELDAAALPELLRVEPRYEVVVDEVEDISGCRPVFG